MQPTEAKEPTDATLNTDPADPTEAKLPPLRMENAANALKNEAKDAVDHKEAIDKRLLHDHMERKLLRDRTI